MNVTINKDGLKIKVRGSAKKVARLVRLLEESQIDAVTLEDDPSKWISVPSLIPFSYPASPYTVPEDCTSPTVVRPIPLETIISSSTVTTNHGDNT